MRGEKHDRKSDSERESRKKRQQRKKRKEGKVVDNAEKTKGKGREEK